MGHAVKGASALCAPRTAASKSCAGKDGDERMPAGNGTHQEPPPLTLNWAMLISTRTSLPPCMRRQAATNGRGVVSTSALSGPAAQEAMTALTLVKRKQSHSTASEGGRNHHQAQMWNALPAQACEARRRLAWLAAARRHACSARAPGRADGGGGRSAGRQERGQPSRQLLCACVRPCCRSARPQVDVLGS